MGGDPPSSLPGSVSRETQSICLLYILISLLLQIFPAHTRSCYPPLCASRKVSSCYVLLFFMDIIATKLYTSTYLLSSFSRPLYGPQASATSLVYLFEFTSSKGSSFLCL